MGDNLWVKPDEIEALLHAVIEAGNELARLASNELA
jgi:hypothetical protein